MSNLTSSLAADCTGLLQRRFIRTLTEKTPGADRGVVAADRASAPEGDAVVGAQLRQGTGGREDF